MTDHATILKLEGWLKSRPSFLMCFIVILLTACGELENKRIVEYQGPLRVADNIELQYAEDDSMRVHLTAGKLLEFRNGDRDFPEKIFIEFYKNGTVTSTLSADHAYYFKVANKWRAQGNVQLKSMNTDEQLNTEELYWFPRTRKINSEKFVTVRTGREVIYGTGLDATQDLSSYQIRRVEGEFEVDDQP